MWSKGVLDYDPGVCCFKEVKTIQGLTNPLSSCPGQVKIFAGQVKYFLTCPEKCIRYIGKPKEMHRTSRSNFDLSSPAIAKNIDNSCLLNQKYIKLLIHR